MIENYFSQAILHQGGIYRNSLLLIEDGDINVTPLENETAFTIYISGCIVVGCAEKIDSSIISEMNAIVGKHAIGEVLSQINSYLKENSLYLPSDEKKQQGNFRVTLLGYNNDIGWYTISFR